MWNAFKINRIDAANSKYTIMHINCISVSYDPNHILCIKTRDRSNKEKVPPLKGGFIVTNYIWAAFKKYYLNITSKRQVTYKQFQIYLDTEDILTFT
jgi:hypothetical protein